MASKTRPSQPPALAEPIGLLFEHRPARKPTALILPRFLQEEARKEFYRTEAELSAQTILIKWADLEKQGALTRKEKSLYQTFLNEVFGQALGYRLATDSPQEYELEHEFAVPGGGSADGAIGVFHSGQASTPLAVIELKSADVYLDRKQSGGRSPVDQCFDYLLELPGCPWGIVSNFVTFRLYHREKTKQVYQEFKLQDLRDLEVFRQFYCLFERGGIIGSVLRPARTMMLLEKTATRQREVGDELYEDYSAQRLALIKHLKQKHHKEKNEAIRIAQKILDRIIFVAFCEDRGLMPDGKIDEAYRNVLSFSDVTNPRWRNFLALFSAVNTGKVEAGINRFNGGLFEDPDVDNLQLEDEWTHFFSRISKYDFCNEVNVDVLGHLFERSVTELERLRTGGLLGEEAEESIMPKSAERKRFGIYYTPPEFTKLIVERSVGDVICKRLAGLKDPSDKIAALRSIKVCDPACGSGAFLIAAYDRLEQAYKDVLDEMEDSPQTAALYEEVPDYILHENIYGMDLSAEAVEITQLALWIRSARRGHTLANLSKNIVCGNSLVSDSAVHEKAKDWAATFPEIFARGGFDCVIGNPPWERMKLQEREFFSFSAPKIAGAVSAADRRKMIVALEKSNPALYAEYQQAQAAAERMLEYIRTCGRYPLTGQGDVNTYMVFAELARTLVAPTGRVGLLVPSGIATDHTTREFFADLMDQQSLMALYDFENKLPYFPDVHRAFKFSVLVLGGSQVKTTAADFAFFLHNMEELKESKRHIPLSQRELLLLNPNTLTCPIFRSQRDFKLTHDIYRRVRVLIDHHRKNPVNANPWGLRFMRMFDQTNDAELFLTHAQLAAKNSSRKIKVKVKTRKELAESGLRQEGNEWTNGEHYLPLYEAKMIQAYDHQAASVKVQDQNWVRQGQTLETSLVEHQNPQFTVQPRFWVEAEEVQRIVKTAERKWLVGFKDITSPTNERTMISAVIPYSAVTNHFPLIFTEHKARRELCLLANFNTVVYDYLTRQKIGGITLNFFIVEQIPTLPPDRYAEKCPWELKITLERWISERVLKLTCTAEDLLPLAEAAEFKERVHPWDSQERHRLCCELDAAYFHLYGLAREEADYILSTFPTTQRRDEAEFGHYKTRDDILAEYDRLKSAM